MSEMRYKMVIRGRIPEMDGNTPAEVITAFRKQCGEPDDIDEHRGVIDHFFYDEAKRTLSPVSGLNDGRWGLQRLVDEHEEMEASVSSDQLAECLSDMQQLFPTIESVTVFAYGWYTGVDEPVSLPS